MSETKNILIVGVGGQGIILASELLATVAMTAGYKPELLKTALEAPPIFQNNSAGKKIKYVSRSEVFRKTSLVRPKRFNRLPETINAKTGKRLFKIIKL